MGVKKNNYLGESKRLFGMTLQENEEICQSNQLTVKIRIGHDFLSTL